jgi:hypothetical protein
MEVSLTYETFLTLSRDRQLQLIWQQGTFLTCRQQLLQTVGLYQLGPFFCEVFVDDDASDIRRVHAFTNRWYLEPYLNSITLGDLPALNS